MMKLSSFFLICVLSTSGLHAFNFREFCKRNKTPIGLTAWIIFGVEGLYCLGLTLLDQKYNNLQKVGLASTGIFFLTLSAAFKSTTPHLSEQNR